MPTVSDVMDKAARGCSVVAPSNWIATTQLTYLELKDILSDTVDELLERVDWPDPITLDTTISGDGTADYSLPSDFKRVTRDPLAVFETTGTRRACVPVATNGAWTALNEFGSAGGNRYYRINGDEEGGFEIEFFDTPQLGDSIKVSYVTKNWLKQSGAPASTWANDGDTLLLPQRLVELGVIWRYRRRKGLSFNDRLAEYEAILARRANDARGVRKIDMSGDGEMRNPFDIPVPDFIPPS